MVPSSNLAPSSCFTVEEARVVVGGLPGVINAPTAILPGIYCSLDYFNLLLRNKLTASPHDFYRCFH